MLSIPTLDLVLWVAFFYFCTLSGDLLNVKLFLFKAKVNHLFAFLLVPLFFFGGRGLHLPRSIGLATLWIVSALAISATFSVLPARCYGYIAAYFIEFFCYFLIPFNLMMRFDHEKLLKVYMTSFTVVGLYALSQLLLSVVGIRDPFVGQWIGRFARPHAFAYEPSYYALYMTPCVMFFSARFLFGETEKRGLRLAAHHALLLLSTSTGIFFGYLGFLVVSLCVALLRTVRPYIDGFRRRFLRLIYGLVVIFAIMGALLAELFRNYFFKFFVAGFLTHGSFATRLEGMLNCWKIFLDHPFFGVGVGGVGPYLWQEKFGIPLDATATIADVELFDPTNVFTEVLASLGLYGFFGFCLLAGCWIRAFRRVLHKKGLTQEERLTAISLAVSLVTMLFVLQFNQGLFRNYVWVHVAITYGYFVKITSSDVFREGQQVPSSRQPLFGRTPWRASHRG
jgi:O-antigen ligase